LILAGPVVGMLSTVVGMADSYHTIESVEAPTPGDLAVGVRISTFGTVAGLTLSVIGLGLLAWTLIQSARFPCAGR
jgi:biopolymer transport protein ExbB/TolQ